MNTNPTDLITKAKQGDSEAMQQIFNDYRGLIRSIVNRFFLVCGEKEDLLQEGMLGLFRAVNDFDQTKGAFPSFVKLCVSRAVLTAIKSANSGKNKPFLNYVEISTLNDVVFHADSPLDSMISSEGVQNIQRAIDSLLTKSEKIILNLFLEGFSYEEICQKTAKTPKAVDGALQRSRKKLLSVVKEQDQRD